MKLRNDLKVERKTQVIEMEERKLQELVERISIDYFNKPFQHRAYFNKPLRTTGGRYHLKTHNLDFNPKVFEQFNQEIIEGIIKHELCHYHLHIEGRGYKHSDQDFKQLMAEVNGLRFTPSIERKQDYISRWEYECSGCNSTIFRKRRFNVEKYICSSCKNKFILKGRKDLSNIIY